MTSMEAEAAQEHIHIHNIDIYLGGYFVAHFICRDILMLGRSPIKWKQCQCITFAVDWYVK